MSEDYLWDRGGPPDPELERLERALSPYRWRGPSPAWEDGNLRPGYAEKSPWRFGLPVALAAGALLVCGTLWWPGRRQDAAPAHYRIEYLAGKFTAAAAGGAVPLGERLITDPATRARLHVGDIGVVELEPESELHVMEPSGDGADYQLFLARGRLTASIFAAPRLFQVGTPSGLAVDLGCVYRATVEDDGGALLQVISGRVSFEGAARAALVPAGASVRAYPDLGPGTPVWDDAPEAWRAAVAYLDRPPAAKDPAAGLAEALDTVLATGRERDSLTLWHLLGHADRQLRARVYDRLARLAPPPPGVTRDGCVAGDARELERWRDTFAWN